MAGITIPIAADTRQAAKEVGDLSKGFDKVADSLDDVAKESTKSGNKLEDSMKDAQRETKETAEAFQQLARTQKQANQDSTNDFELSTREKRKLSRETVKEIGDEAKQNASETLSSFNGSAQSFMDAIQGTLGGLVSSLGPLGLVIGGTAALGLGAINGALQNGSANSEQFKQDVSDLTQALIDAGNHGEVSVDRIVENLKKLATTGDDAGLTLSKLDDLTKRSGNSFEDAARAYAGNSDALKEMVKQGKEHLEQLERQGAATDQNNDKQRAAYAGIIDQANAQKDLNGYLEQASQKADEAAKNAKLYAESGAAELERKAEQVKNIGDAYSDAASDSDDFFDSETKAFDTSGYIKKFQELQEEIKRISSDLASSGLSDAAKAFIEGLPEEQQAIFLNAYKAANPNQRDQLDAIWAQNGASSARNYGAGLQAGLPRQIAGPDIVATWRVDRSALDAAIRSQVNVTVPVKVVYKDANSRVW